MVKIIWTNRAFGQLERAVNYIKEERGSSYAAIVLDKVVKSTSLLGEHPQLGTIEKLLKHKKSEYRFLLAFAYKIIYRVEKDRVVISRIFHTSQNPNKLKGV
ncbi:MAG: type II toxin-antitoxin system RelE/ParE family toxin [Bacteroidetes bacterium]|nr:type II toxin-antitoxin system RelE/ParE family toxin [Bacteroidota bacterium]MBI3482186.1 type II toxin-antitoxin system RelE/ParE family toxin [Bacteroidota bacterium]